MHQSHSQTNTLLVVVAILAIVGGLGIVIVTSPQSWQYGPQAWIQALITTPTPEPPVIATPTATATVTPTTAPPSPTVQTAVLAFTATPTVIDTATPEITPTVTPPSVPADVIALATVNIQGAGSARLRSQPGGDTIVAAVPSGTQVQVLGGKVEFNNVVWVQVRLAGGQVGWIAEFLLHITQTFS